MKSKVLTILLSAAIAFGLWLYVITVERTQIEYTFYNVPVVMDGESVLEDRGLMITSDTDQTVNLTLSGNRSVLNKLKSSDITVLVDLTRIYEAGEKLLNYDVSFPGDVQNSAIEIVRREPDHVALTVAKWEMKEIPVRIDIHGTPADGYKIDYDNIEPASKNVSISGPKELIDRISHARVSVNMENATSAFGETMRLTLCDSDDQPLDEDLSNVYVENSTVTVRVPILKEKQIELRLPIIPGGGLTEDDVTLEMSMTSITVSGRPGVIDKMADFIELGTIDLREITENFAGREYTFTLPEGVKSQEGNSVEVSLTLPEMATRLILVPQSQFEARNVPEGYEVTYAGKGINVTLQGRSSTLGRIQPTDIRVIVDLSDITDSGDCPVEVEVSNTQEVGAIVDPQVPYKVHVLLTPVEREP